jgi:hypothetical protein
MPESLKDLIASSRRHMGIKTHKELIEKLEVDSDIRHLEQVDPRETKEEREKREKQLGIIR